MKYRLRKVARVVLAAAITVVVAGAAAAVAIYATGPGGLVSCVPAALPAKDPIPRWVIAAGIPAIVAALMGAFFALAPERVFFRLVGADPDRRSRGRNVLRGLYVAARGLPTLTTQGQRFSATQ